MASLARQCWLFAVGSVLFAVATAPGFPAVVGAGAVNAACFAGSWFFTAAAGLQLAGTDPEDRLEWSSGAAQLVGALLYNLSTGSAVWAHAVSEERRYVWAPDAFGSAAFLVSGVLAMVAVIGATGVVALRSRRWHAATLNLAGCVAFGVSAMVVFVRQVGVTEDERLANLGTFVGALCFLVAALLTLPRSARRTG
ncbi:hypothetical protein ACQI4F_15375 [Mycolicibacterium vaccae]|uniref:hypothetical protein n=1 Tax=Mycolicibacterium vaccae TaxID=1810 RepID=UPI003CE96590